MSDERPPLAHVEWVFRHLVDALMETGTFRELIYDRMGFDEDAYQPLYEAGGMALTNAFCNLEDARAALARIVALEPEPMLPGMVCHVCGGRSRHDEPECAVVIARAALEGKP